jgi:hypothetical protein
MTDLETSFTVEVLGFREGADPEALAEAVSGFFGISMEDGRRLVRKAPVRVKRGASAEITQRLVKQLRKLGADVLVRNEQTGDERTYRSTDGSAPSRRSLPQGAPPEETLESDPGDPPPEEAPAVEVAPPPARAEEGAEDAPPAEDADTAEPAEGALDDLAAASAPGERTSPSAPDEIRGAAPDDVDSGRTSLPLSPRRSSSGVSLPPSSSPGLAPPASPILSLPPPSTSKLDFCAACKAPVDKGETCSRCGWNNAEKERHCRQCKRKLSVVSAMSRSAALTGVAALGAVAIGGALLAMLGAGAGVAGLALGGCLAFVADGFTVRYACKVCTVAVVSERLQKEEEGRLRTARTKSLGVAVLCGVVAAGLIAATGFSERALSDSSYGISWSLPLPRLNTHLGTDLASIRIPTGNKKIRISFAERPYVGGPAFFLTHVQTTHPAAAVQRDPAGLEASIKQVVEVYFQGSLSGKIEPAGDGVQATFTGTFHGKPVHGYLRGMQHEHDMMIVGVTSGSPGDVADADNRAVLGRVVVQRDPG